MDDVRIGFAIRAIRIRRGWRQADLAERASVSQSLVSLLEAGRLTHVSLAALRRVVAALDARVDIGVHWRGGEIDRLLDRRHAMIVDSVVRVLNVGDWRSRAEVSFSRYGERGSIDVFAWSVEWQAMLLIEVKSAVHSIEETLRRLDIKVRLAPDIGGELLGWRPRVVGSALVLPESSGARRRLLTHAATMASVFPDRGRDVRPWLRKPDRPISAVWFLSDSDLTGTTRMTARRIRVPVPALPSATSVTGTRAAPVGLEPTPGAPASPPTPTRPTTFMTDDRTALASAGFILDDRDSAPTR